jgi:hypothetical protein
MFFVQLRLAGHRSGFRSRHGRGVVQPPAPNFALMRVHAPVDGKRQPMIDALVRLAEWRQASYPKA